MTLQSAVIQFRATILSVILCLLPAVAVGLTSTAIGALPPQYSILDLNHVGSPRSFATDINDNGDVVGAMGVNSNVAQGPTVGVGDQGFLYRNGVTTLIDRMGGASGSAFSINNIGQIVGAVKSLAPPFGIH